jgi:hypothetical protein
MLRALHLPDKLRRSLVKSGITGEIGSHGAKTNLDSIDRLLKLDPYVTFGIDTVNEAVRQRQVDHAAVIKVMADALGTTIDRFQQPGPGYIDPQWTATKLSLMLDRLTESAQKRRLFLLATSHPGSLLTYYSMLGRFVAKQGGTVYRVQQPFQVGEYRWFDQVDGVHVLSDEGNLMHTHDSGGFAHFLRGMSQKPDVIVADHGYAGAAINAGIYTISIHDVDDPGIPLAEHLGSNVLIVPMNDNQLNVPTAVALQALIDSRDT